MGILLNVVVAIEILKCYNLRQRQGNPKLKASTNEWSLV